MNVFERYQYLKDYEPVATGGAITAVVVALIGVVSAFGPQFGVTLDGAQVGALLGLAAAAEVWLTKLERDKVSPVARFDDTKDDSLANEEHQ